jgi:tetratricopeptide (TPR) repeat protein
MFKMKVAFALIVLAASIATAKVMAQDTKVMAQDTSNHSIGTHQIDRFEAIQMLRESLKSNPSDAAAWIVLGELAHEVAQDLSSQDDEPYYKLSQEAYEKALALQPNNAGLKAAVEFAREQKTGAAQWDQARRDAASSYVEVRKSELAASGFNPTVQAYSRPTPPTPPAPPAPPEAVAATNSAPASQPAVIYQYPVYQPYYVQGAQPYTYQQYAGGYLYTVPVYNTSGTVPGMHGAHRRRSERG